MKNKNKRNSFRLMSTNLGQFVQKTVVPSLVTLVSCLNPFHIFSFDKSKFDLACSKALETKLSRLDEGAEKKGVELSNSDKIKCLHNTSNLSDIFASERSRRPSRGHATIRDTLASRFSDNFGLFIFRPDRVDELCVTAAIWVVSIYLACDSHRRVFLGNNMSNVPVITQYCLNKLRIGSLGQYSFLNSIVCSTFQVTYSFLPKEWFDIDEDTAVKFLSHVVHSDGYVKVCPLVHRDFNSNTIDLSAIHNDFEGVTYHPGVNHNSGDFNETICVGAMLDARVCTSDITYVSLTNMPHCIVRPLNGMTAEFVVFILGDGSNNSGHIDGKPDDKGPKPKKGKSKLKNDEPGNTGPAPTPTGVEPIPVAPTVPRGAVSMARGSLPSPGVDEYGM